MSRSGLRSATEGREFGESRDSVDIMPENTQRHQTDVDGALLDANGVAELLRVPASWVYAEARAGRIPHVRVGRYRRFRRSALEAWVEAHERGPVR